jgi:hypothetical protein
VEEHIAAKSSRIMLAYFFRSPPSRELSRDIVEIEEGIADAKALVRAEGNEAIDASSFNIESHRTCTE